MSRVTWIVGIAGLLVPAAAHADQYVVSYEADGVYPEDCGWTRLTFGGGAERWFEDGCLVIDSRSSIDIVDSYSMLRPGQLDPSAPGEWVFMSWRMRTDELQGLCDSAVGVFSDDRRLVSLSFEWDGVLDPWEGHVVATFEPGVFHDFELRSFDMVTYNLYVDGTLAHTGYFTDPLLTASKVFWGDEVQGAASLTRWDRFSFGVFPEPTSALVGVTLLAVARAVSRGKSR